MGPDIKTNIIIAKHFTYKTGLISTINTISNCQPEEEVFCGLSVLDVDLFYARCQIFEVLRAIMLMASKGNFFSSTKLGRDSSSSIFSTDKRAPLTPLFFTN